jgi:hypothetical protein
MAARPITAIFMINILKYHGIAIFLISVLTGFQYGCTTTVRSDSTLSARNPSSVPRRRMCPGGDGAATACRSIQQQMQQLKKPEDLDDFFANLHYLVYSDLLQNPAFYDSDEFVSKAFGATNIRREANPSRGFKSITINVAMGDSLIRPCEINIFSGERPQLFCSATALLYLHDHGTSSGTHASLSSIQEDELLDKIYDEFRNVFGGGWEDIDAFDKQRGEKVIMLGVFNRSIPQPVPDGFGKDIPVDDVIYRVKVGRTINGNWNGIAIAIKPEMASH